MSAICKIMLCLLWIFIAIPILTLPVVFLAMWKLVSYISVWLRWRGQGNVPEPLDVLSCLMAIPGQYPYICWVFKLDGRISRQEFISHFEKRFQIGDKCKFPLLYQITHLGFFYKELVLKIDLNQHIIERDVELSETEGLEEAVFLANQETPVPSNDLPHWDFLLLQSRKTIMVFRMHHSMADGNSIRLIFDHLFTDGFKPETLRKVDYPSFFRKVLAILTIPTTLWSAKEYAKPLQGADGQVPFKSTAVLPSPSSNPRMARVTLCWGKLSFTEVESLARASGTKVMSVLITLKILALRSVFEARGEDTSNWGKGLQEAVAKARWRQPIVEEGRTCNHVTIAPFIIPLKTGNGKEQLLLVDKAVRDFEKLGFFLTLSVLMDLMEYFMVLRCFTVKAGMKMEETAAMSVTNPCIKTADKMTLLGREVEEVHFIPYFDDVWVEKWNSTMRGIIFTPITRGDVIDFNVCASKDILRDREEAAMFASAINSELRKLRDEFDSLG